MSKPLTMAYFYFKIEKTGEHTISNETDVHWCLGDSYAMSHSN